MSIEDGTRARLVRREPPRFTVEQLVKRYRDGGGSRRARKLLAGFSPTESSPDLDWLLRDHNEQGDIDDQLEIEQRDDVDQLLGLYALVEIGLIGGALEEPLGARFEQSARAHLFQPDVRRFYKERYPVLLPMLLHDRLRGSTVIREANAGDSLCRSAYEHFLSLEERARTDKELDTFLWFLDDGYSDGESWEDMAQLLRSPAEFFKAAYQRRPTPATRAACGFWQFMAFSEEFDALLRQLAERPLLQSAMWHFFGYWYGAIKSKLRREVRALTGRVSRWGSEVEDPVKFREGLTAAVGRSSEAIERLLGGAYGRALVEAERAARGPARGLTPQS